MEEVSEVDIDFSPAIVTSGNKQPRLVKNQEGRHSVDWVNLEQLQKKDNRFEVSEAYEASESLDKSQEQTSLSRNETGRFVSSPLKKQMTMDEKTSATRNVNELD